MKKVHTRRMQAAEVRMMCEKMLHDGILNSLLRVRSGVEDIENHLGENRLRWLRHLERKDETNLVKRVREERVPRHIKRGRLKKSWDEVVKEDMKKRGLCINDPKTETSGDDAAEEWSTPVNWEENPAKGKDDGYGQSLDSMKW